MRLTVDRVAKVSICGLAVLGALALGACGNGDGKSKKRAPTEKTSATVKPGAFCQALQERKALGRHPPELGLFLQGQDLDNFSGESSAQCNTRSFVYWGPANPLPQSDRPVVIATLSFTQGADEAALVGASTESLESVQLGDGTEMLLFRRSGQASGRFVVGKAVVDVSVACIRQNKPLATVPCRRPPQSQKFLDRRLRKIALKLRRELKGRI